MKGLFSGSEGLGWPDPVDDWWARRSEGYTEWPGWAVIKSDRLGAGLAVQ